jgi:hypothetical protein
LSVKQHDDLKVNCMSWNISTQTVTILSRHLRQYLVWLAQSGMR